MDEGLWIKRMNVDNSCNGSQVTDRWLLAIAVFLIVFEVIACAIYMDRRFSAWPYFGVIALASGGCGFLAGVLIFIRRRQRILGIVLVFAGLFAPVLALLLSICVAIGYLFFVILRDLVTGGGHTP